MNHAHRVLRQELAILRDTYHQVLGDRAIEGRADMLAELSREVIELRDALCVLTGASHAERMAAE